MDYASVVLTEAVKAAPHYTVLGLLVWLGIYLRERRLHAIVPLRRG